jgi:hypothetical protein
MNNYTEEQVKDMLDKNSQFHSIEIDKLRNVIDVLKADKERYKKALISISNGEPTLQKHTQISQDYRTYANFILSKENN